MLCLEKPVKLMCDQVVEVKLYQFGLVPQSPPKRWKGVSLNYCVWKKSYHPSNFISLTTVINIFRISLESSSSELLWVTCLFAKLPPPFKFSSKVFKPYKDLINIVCKKTKKFEMGMILVKMKMMTRICSLSRFASFSVRRRLSLKSPQSRPIHLRTPFCPFA